MAQDDESWSAEEICDALGRIREAIEESIPARLIGRGEGMEPTFHREVSALVQAIRLMGAHMPDRLDDAIVAEMRAWSADVMGSGSDGEDDGEAASP
jgi:hypothetical protein